MRFQLYLCRQQLQSWAAGESSLQKFLLGCARVCINPGTSTVNTGGLGTLPVCQPVASLCLCNAVMEAKNVNYPRTRNYQLRW